MRQALILGLLAGVLVVGCNTTGPTTSTSWLQRPPPLQGLVGSDVVVMQVALVERPIGDGQLNQDLWQFADEQSVPLERKALLEDNGLRIGIVGGITPTGLMDLLTSEKSCPDPRRVMVHAGSETRPFPLGPPWEKCRFQVKYGEKPPRSLEFTRAECEVRVLPTLTADGRTRLRFTPQIRHGEPGGLQRPSADRAHWVVPQDQSVEDLDPLAWEITVAPNEFVVIGTWLDRPETLGHRCFVRADGPTPIQRMLVIRTARSDPELVAPDAGEFKGTPPLALQAALVAPTPPAP